MPQSAFALPDEGRIHEAFWIVGRAGAGGLRLRQTIPPETVTAPPVPVLEAVMRPDEKGSARTNRAICGEDGGLSFPRSVAGNRVGVVWCEAAFPVLSFPCWAGGSAREKRWTVFEALPKGQRQKTPRGCPLDIIYLNIRQMSQRTSPAFTCSVWKRIDNTQALQRAWDRVLVLAWQEMLIAWKTPERGVATSSDSNATVFEFALWLVQLTHHRTRPTFLLW